jgi:hypothetical protein
VNLVRFSAIVLFGPTLGMASLLLGACAHRRVADTTTNPSGDPCLVVVDSSVRRDTVSVALIDSVSLMSAPIPRNPSERILFRQLFETLVRLDCSGRIRPALARRWSRDAGGTMWTFELDSAAAGSRLTADRVRSFWDQRRNGGIWPWPRILAVDSIGPLTLRVRLDTAYADLPAAFALPELAVTGMPATSRSFPSGAFREFFSARPNTGPLIGLMQLVPSHSMSSVPILRFQMMRNGIDVRDVFDLPSVGLLRPADLATTRDPLAVSYARANPDFRTIPLPWDRTYVLIAPVSLSSEDASSPTMSSEFRDSLADEVVRAESRGAAPPFWWDNQLRCPGTRPLRPMSRISQVVYPRDDQTARELAERLVALSGSADAPRWTKALLSPSDGTLRTAGLRSSDLESSLAGGEARAYVLPLSRILPVSCTSAPQWPSGSTVIPLVDSRATVIARRGVPPFLIDGDGAIRFLPGSPSDSTLRETP